MSEQGLAYFGNRIAPRLAEPRRAAIKRSLSGALVVLVHLILLAAMTFSIVQQKQRSGRRGPVETLLDLSLLRNSEAPPVSLVRPEVQSKTPTEVDTAPITITPPKPLPEEKAGPAAPGDVLRAIGEALACGASNFENLTDAQRARCRHQPWIARKLPNGTIVLDAPPKPQDQPQVHMSGADTLRHDTQTSPGCPIMLQVPCVDDILSGRNNRP